MREIVVQLSMFFFLTVICLQLLVEAAAVSSPPMAKPGCQDKCGNITVPFPFGIGDKKCYLNSSFQLSCQNDLFPKFMFHNLTIQNISVEDATVTVDLGMADLCYDESRANYTLQEYRVDLSGSPFMFSDTGNKFFAVGSNTDAYIGGIGSNTDAYKGDIEGKRFISGCKTLLPQPINNTIEEGSCSGVGCCQTQIPKGVQTLEIVIQNISEYDDEIDFACSYAYLAINNSSEFKTIELKNNRDTNRAVPALLDWVMANETCESVNKSSSCGNNTDCKNYSDGFGYQCRCKPGYQGNPYLFDPQGCQDINECLDPKTYGCEGKCKNIPGNYTCRCPFGMHGDGKRACQGFRISTLATVCGVVMLLLVIILLYWRRYKRIKKFRNFERNGGCLLKHQQIRIFTADELEKVTDKYDDARLLGRGGSASVYKGTLSDGSPVAIKKPNEVDVTKIKHLGREVINTQFKQEIRILCHVNHRNVVKLLGLCLETKVPFLVYEFVSNGSLFDHLHAKCTAMLKSWIKRLSIAAEVAQSLDYLHSLADPPIIHRDIKSMNILLDDNFTAKVSDFGASVLIPFGQSGVAMNIQGTLGYIDPEYLITGILTAKSDVYSFGVVLMELLTGQKPVSNWRSLTTMNSIQYFISSVECKRLSHVLMYSPSEIEVDHKRENEEMEAVAELAKMCLNRSGSERPTMKEVAEQLMGIRNVHNTFHASNEGGDEETMRLLHYNVNKEDVYDSISNTLYETAFEVEAL